MIYYRYVHPEGWLLWAALFIACCIGWVVWLFVEEGRK